MSFAQNPLLPVIAHSVVIYVFLMVLLHIIGRRQLGQLTVLDLVVVILLGSAVETAMVNGNTSLFAGLVCAGTLLFLNRVFALTFGRARRLRHLANGGAVLLVHNGHIVEEHLRRVGLTKADLLEALREREQSGIENIKFAVMEVDGKINVVPKEAEHHRSGPVPSRRTSAVGQAAKPQTPPPASRAQPTRK